MGTSGIQSFKPTKLSDIDMPVSAQKNYNNSKRGNTSAGIHSYSHGENSGENASSKENTSSSSVSDYNGGSESFDFSDHASNYGDIEIISVEGMSEEDISSYIDDLVAVYGFTEEEVRRIIIDGDSFEEVFDGNYDEHVKAMEEWLELLDVVPPNISSNMEEMHSADTCADMLHFIQNFPYLVCAEGLNSERGIPITNDLIAILRKNGIDSQEFYDYCNEHFAEYSEYYLDNYLGQYCAFTDEQRIELLKCKTLDEFNALADEKGYTEEALNRKTFIDLINNEYQYMLFARTGCYTFEELDDKIADLEKKYDSLKFRLDHIDTFYVGEYGSEAIINNDINELDALKGELDELKQNRDSLSEEFSKRVEDEILYNEIRNSGVLEQYDYHGKLFVATYGRLDQMIELHPTCDNYVFNAYEAMSDEERKLFCYLYDVKGHDAAAAFLSRRCIQEKIASRVAIDEVREFTDIRPLDDSDYDGFTEISWDEALEILNSDNARSLVYRTDENGVHYYLGKEDCMYMTSYIDGKEIIYEVKPHGDDSDFNGWMQIATKAVKDDNENFLKGVLPGQDEIGFLANEKLSAAYSLYKGGRFVYDMSSAVSGYVRNRMIEIIPGVGPYLALSANLAATAKNKYGKTIVQGYDPSSALTYTLLSAGLTTAVDIIIGKLPIPKELKDKIINCSMPALKKYALSVVLGAISGGGQYVAEGALRSSLLGEEVSLEWEEFFYQAGIGAASAALFHLDQAKYIVKDFKILLEKGKSMAAGFSNFKDNLIKEWKTGKTSSGDSSLDGSNSPSPGGSDISTADSPTEGTSTSGGMGDSGDDVVIEGETTSPSDRTDTPTGGTPSGGTSTKGTSTSGGTGDSGKPKTPIPGYTPPPNIKPDKPLPENPSDGVIDEKPKDDQAEEGSIFGNTMKGAGAKIEDAIEGVVDTVKEHMDNFKSNDG